MTAALIQANPANEQNHDSGYSTTYMTRGNVTTSVTPKGTDADQYDIAGNAIYTSVNGLITNSHCQYGNQLHGAIPDHHKFAVVQHELEYLPGLELGHGTEWGYGLDRLRHERAAAYEHIAPGSGDDVHIQRLGLAAKQGGHHQWPLGADQHGRFRPDH